LRRRRRLDQHASTQTVSSEPILSASRSSAGEPCTCGALLADDQRYCLECGERRAPRSSALLGALAAQQQSPGSEQGPWQGPAAPAGAPSRAPMAGGGPPAGAPAQPPIAHEGRPGSALTLIAGVGVLLLAMGVGILIGRSGARSSTAVPSAITVGATPTTAPARSNARSEASFSGDWPAGTSGYTVQLQALPVSSTSVAQVQAAKSAASGRGAKRVGALESDEFSGLPAGQYLIYAGVYHERAEAAKVLGALERSFPGAKVIHVVGRGRSAAESAAESREAAAEGNQVGQSLTHPAPPSVVRSLNRVKGKSYEERSRNLPNVVSTG
jgi:hypothetical protein